MTAMLRHWSFMGMVALAAAAAAAAGQPARELGRTEDLARGLRAALDRTKHDRHAAAEQPSPPPAAARGQTVWRYETGG